MGSWSADCFPPKNQGGVHVGAGVFGQGPRVGVVSLGAGPHLFIGDVELGLTGESGKCGGKAVGEVDDFGKRDGFRFGGPERSRQAGCPGDSGGGGEERAAAEVTGDNGLAMRSAHGS
jgi:hypothetical protein